MQIDFLFCNLKVLLRTKWFLLIFKFKSYLIFIYFTFRCGFCGSLATSDTKWNLIFASRNQPATQSSQSSKKVTLITMADISKFGPKIMRTSFNWNMAVFKRGMQNSKDFCLRINILKGNYWILRIGLMGRCQKVPKFDFQSQFSMSKIIRIFLNFFFHWRILI